MPSSNKVSSLYKYIAPLVAAAVISFTPPKIAPQYIKSNQIEESITVGSYGHAQPTMIRTKDGYVTRTSGNRFFISSNDFFENGPLSNNDEYGHGHWKYASERSPPIDHNYVPLPPRTPASIAVESFEERLASFPYGDTSLPKYVRDFDMSGFRINEAGKKLYELHNLRHHLNSYLKTEDGKELPETLKALGGVPTPIDILGTGGLPEGAIYGVNRTKDGILLTAAEDSYDKIARDAKYLDIDTYDLMNTMLAEELAHIWFRDFDKDGDNIKIEKAAKEVVLRHYLRLAKGAQGDPKKRWLYEKRLRQARVKEKDYETTEERYSKKGSFHKKLYSESREDLEDLLAEEAADKGYKGRAAREYVSKRLEEIGDEDSKDSRMSRLERIAEKGDKEADSKEASSEAPSE